MVVHGKGDEAHSKTGCQEQTEPASERRDEMIVVFSENSHNGWYSYGIRIIKSSIMKDYYLFLLTDFEQI